MIGCLKLGRETFDVNFANEKINLVEKRLNKLSNNIIFFEKLVTNDEISEEALSFFKQKKCKKYLIIQSTFTDSKFIKKFTKVFKKPIFLKVSPDETDESIEMIINLVKKSSITGLVATNTTIDKKNLNNKKLKKEDGGVSGQPLMDKSTNKISLIRSKCSDIPIIGVGGVMSKKDYLSKLNAGADLVQIYTGFIIKGPNLINQIVRD